MNNNRLAIRMSAVAASCVAASFLFVGVSYAHIEPEPIAIEAGKSATVSFSPGHGCDGSPTTSLAFKMPGSVNDAAPVSKIGWEASTADGVVTFSGGSLEATKVESFAITFTAPSAAGPIFFPVVQKCVKGQINWIDMPNPDGSEAEFAAPTVNVTAPKGSDEIELSDGVAVGRDDDDDNDNDAITIALIVVLAVALVAAGGVIYSKRADKDD